MEQKSCVEPFLWNAVWPFSRTLEQPLQRTLPGTGGGAGRGGAVVRVGSDAVSGAEGRTASGAIACKTVPLPGIKIAVGPTGVGIVGGPKVLPPPTE